MDGIKLKENNGRSVKFVKAYAQTVEIDDSIIYIIIAMGLPVLFYAIDFFTRQCDQNNYGQWQTKFIKIISFQSSSFVASCDIAQP